MHHEPNCFCSACRDVMFNILSMLPAGTTLIADGKGQFRINKKYHGFQVPIDKRSCPTFNGNIKQTLNGFWEWWDESNNRFKGL